MSDNNNCDGTGPHDPGEVRVYPLGGGANLIVCVACWAKENKYRYERAVLDGNGRMRPEPQHDLWPQEDWGKAEVYQP